MWSTKKGINTPKGVYVPTSDDLTKELLKAAEFAGLARFNVKIDGAYVEKPEHLHTNSVKALAAEASIESVTVEPRDVAGRY